MGLVFFFNLHCLTNANFEQIYLKLYRFTLRGSFEQWVLLLQKICRKIVSKLILLYRKGTPHMLFLKNAQLHVPN